MLSPYLIVHLALAFEHYPAEILNTVLDVKSFTRKSRLGLIVLGICYPPHSGSGYRNPRKEKVA